MLTYYLDANVILRFLLRDNEKFYSQAKEVFTSAQQGEVQLVVTIETILELNYVLRGVYTLSREKTAEQLSVIVSTPYLDISDRSILSNALQKYLQLNVDFADCILFEKARAADAEVFSFDSDMKKLAKLG